MALTSESLREVWTEIDSVLFWKPQGGKGDSLPEGMEMECGYREMGWRGDAACGQGWPLRLTWELSGVALLGGRSRKMEGLGFSCSRVSAALGSLPSPEQAAW